MDTVRDFFTFSAAFRLHWSFLASSLVLSCIFFKTLKPFTLKYFNNASAKLDLQLFVFNRIFKLLIVLPFEAFVIFNVLKFVTHSFPSLNLNAPGLVFLFSVFYFVADDLMRFLQHLCMHKVSFLWEIHKVHHSAYTLNPLTLYRVHFLEVLISFLRRVATNVFCVSVFIFLFDDLISVYTIMGVHGATFLFNLFGGNLRHSHTAIRFGVFENIFISPAQHQIHHSKAKKDFDKNFGVALSIWDQCFGSFKMSTPKQKLNFGLSYLERNHKNNLTSALVGPLNFKNRRNLMKKWLLAPLTALLASCGSDNSDSKPPELSVKNFSVEKYSEEIVFDFLDVKLNETTQHLQNILNKTKSCEKNFNSEAYSSLKQDWKQAMLSYHMLAPLKYISKLGENDGEEFVHQKIYDGHLAVDVCDVQFFTYSPDHAFLRKSGLDSLEYLIFKASTKNSCSGFKGRRERIESWLASDQKLVSLCKSIHTFTKNTLSYLNQPKDDIKSFSAEKKDIRSLFTRKPIQSIYDSLTSFVDQEIKDEKLASPIGVNEKVCFKNLSCPVYVEHQASGLYFEALEQNYLGAYKVFSNQDLKSKNFVPDGLYQYLVINKHKDLADKIKNAFEEAHTYLLSFKGKNFFELSKALNGAENQELCRQTTKSNNLKPTCRLYYDSKVLSDLIKVDLKLALSLSNVQQVEGDSD